MKIYYASQYSKEVEEIHPEDGNLSLSEEGRGRVRIFVEELGAGGFGHRVSGYRKVPDKRSGTPRRLFAKGPRTMAPPQDLEPVA